MPYNFYKIFIVPSLQEIIRTGIDNENKPIRYNINKDIIEDRFEYEKEISYNNCLHYIKGNYNCSQDLFWEQLIYFINKMTTPVLNSNFFLVSHHNRIKKTIFEDMIDNQIKIGFANCSCIRIYYENNKWKIKIIFEGYPDDNKYEYLKIGQISIKTIGINKNIEDSKIYKYLNTVKNKKITINIIRHGNSLHNNPLNVNKKNIYNYFFRLYDSPLTILGIYQAKQLKIFLINNNYLIDNENTENIFCASTLNRSQHTVLNLLPNIVKFKNLYRLNNYFNKLVILKGTEYYNLNEMINILTEFYYKKYNIKIKNDLLLLLTN